MCAQGIFAEGKQHAMGVGIMKMSSKEMYANLCNAFLPCARCGGTNLVSGRADANLMLVRSREKNKGVGIETVHVLNDNFWKVGDFV